jgi:hypothetical protein
MKCRTELTLRVQDILLLAKLTLRLLGLPGIPVASKSKVEVGRLGENWR